MSHPVLMLGEHGVHVHANWKVLFVVRSLMFFGFGSTPAEALGAFKNAGGSLKTKYRMTKVTHPAQAVPYIEHTTGSIQFPEGVDGKGTTFEELRLTNGLWIAQ